MTGRYGLWILAASSTRYVKLGVSFNLSDYQFSHLSQVDNNTYLPGVCSKKYVIVYVERTDMTNGL